MGHNPPPPPRRGLRPILRLLSSEGNLLENEEVINTLDRSKDVAKEISAKQVEIENFEVRRIFELVAGNDPSDWKHSDSYFAW